MEDQVKKQFVTAEQSKALKRLGFDEPCMFCFRGNDLYTDSLDGFWNQWGEYNNPTFPQGEYWSTAPTINQVFDWFRDTFQTNGRIDFLPNVKKWDFVTYDMQMNGIEYVKYMNLYRKDHPNRRFDSHYEAEVECLNELIKSIATIQ